MDNVGGFDVCHLHFNSMMLKVLVEGNVRKQQSSSLDHWKLEARLGSRYFLIASVLRSTVCSGKLHVGGNRA